MSQTSEFKPGDFVYCMVEGREGFVTNCDNRGEEYPIGVIFGEGDRSYMRRYTSSGQYLGHGGATLFHEKPEIIVPEKKGPRFKPGTPLVAIHKTRKCVYWFIAGQEKRSPEPLWVGISDAADVGLFPYAEYDFHVVSDRFGSN